ncbi:SusD/RagB family nutrient-binding outer membrane lipoprotein [Zobellia nedashkovskayae]
MIGTQKIKIMKKLYILSLIGFTVLLGSCTDEFDELNENPNSPETVDPQFLLSNIISVEADQNAFSQGFRLANYIQQFAASVEFERIDRYEMGTNSEYWNTIFQLLSDIKSMRELQGSNDAYNAVGDVMQSFLFSQLTDMWGDVPYSDAVNALEGQFTPTYDTQERIYTNPDTGILAVLERASTTLENSNATINGDVLFNGDLNKWMRFANSLRLRYLMRISRRLTDYSEIQALASSGKLMQSNADNAVLPYLASAPNQYPMTLSALGLYQEHRMTTTVDSVLTLWNDPRVNVLYKPTQASVNNGVPEFKGLQNGQGRETIAARGIDLNDVSLFGAIFRDVPDGVDAQFMQYSEVQFALAEAAERGFISGDVQAYYEAGIVASFEYYTVELPVAYLSQETVALNGTDNLNKILTQKWFSLIANGHEAWFNVRRTGIPSLKPGPDNLNNNKYPVRYLYPESEQATNSVNYKTAAERIGGDNINSQNWWEKE